MPVASHWIVDKRIPLALLLGLLVQTGGAVWWASNLSARVAALEQSTASSGSLAERVAVVETRIGDTKASVDRIERKLDNLIDHFSAHP